MTDLICEFCNHVSSTIYNLRRHQKDTIYCLEKQKKEKQQDRFDCSRCEKSYSSKSNLNKHLIICSANLNKERMRLLELENERLKTLLEERDKQILDLKSQLIKKEENQQHITLAAISKPATQVKNTIKNCVIQNLPLLLESDMRNQIQYLTVDHVKAGAEGYAKYALEYPLKDKITCTDVSRRKLAWKDCDGNIIYDDEGSKLAEKFFRILNERSLKIFREIIIDLGDRCDAAYKREDQTEVDAIVQLTDKICTYRSQAVKSGKGEDTELKNEFIKYLCVASKS